VYVVYSDRYQIDLGAHVFHVASMRWCATACWPDMLYVAGAEPFVEDQPGGLNLTFEGLRRRDHLVLSVAREARVPVVVVLAGGYARRIEDTAAIHIATIEEAPRLST
jgi:acetoin utilization deacetylase AcuC-like enzyme